MSYNNIFMKIVSERNDFILDQCALPRKNMNLPYSIRMYWTICKKRKLHFTTYPDVGYNFSADAILIQSRCVQSVQRPEKNLFSFKTFQVTKFSHKLACWATKVKGIKHLRTLYSTGRWNSFDQMADWHSLYLHWVTKRIHIPYSIHM